MSDINQKPDVPSEEQIIAIWEKALLSITKLTEFDLHVISYLRARVNALESSLRGSVEIVKKDNPEAYWAEIEQWEKVLNNEHGGQQDEQSTSAH